MSERMGAYSFLFTPDAPLPTVVMLIIGGMIPTQQDFRAQGSFSEDVGKAVLRRLPGLFRLVDLEVSEIANIPLDYMDPPHWQQLHSVVLGVLAREHVAGIVILHGTDTLEETAWFLDLTIRSAKPVVLVGTPRDSSLLDHDPSRQMAQAIRVCMAPTAVNRGVMVIANGQINAARDVTRSQTDAGTFQSGAFGLLGVVNDERVIFARAPLRRLHLPVTKDELPRVDIVSMYAGADGWLLTAAQALGARGVVIHSLGDGNVNESMFTGIREALGEGIQVVLSTRSEGRRVRPMHATVIGARTLKDAGVIFSNDLSTYKARILLMLALQAQLPRLDIQRLFDR